MLFRSYCDLDTVAGPVPLHLALRDEKEHTTACIWTELVMSPVVAMVNPANTHPVRQGVPELSGNRFANYAMAATAKHPLILAILREIKVRVAHVKRLGMYTPSSIDDYTVLFTTGPDVVTHVVRRLLNKRVHSPVTRGDEVATDQERQEMLGGVRILSLAESNEVLRHTATGSWRHHTDQ